MSDKDVTEILKALLIESEKTIGRSTDYAKGYCDALELAISIVDVTYKPTCIKGGKDE